MSSRVETSLDQMVDELARLCEAVREANSRQSERDGWVHLAVSGSGTTIGEMVGYDAIQVRLSEIVAVRASSVRVYGEWLQVANIDQVRLRLGLR